MKIAFLGTPEFAVPSLKMLIENGHEIRVFTQPDRPKGRGKALQMPPVKEFALENGLEVMQFERIRSAEGAAALNAFAPDLMVTAAFGQILSQENLDAPKYGCINVHGSILPKYRGASPIQTAIICGERVTGITTMMTDIGMDTGDILMTRETEIGDAETYGELYLRLALIGAELLKDTIAALENGTLTRTKQDDELATRCKTIKKSDAFIDFSLPTKRIHDLVRGMNPSPCAHALLNGESVKIHKTRPIGETDELYLEAKNTLETARCGECVVASSKLGLAVKTGDGVIEIVEIQFPNAKRMEARSALNGKKLLGEMFYINEERC
ncbi:MAG: methionyl-tRNA formyltransferase [Clostridia bacterium]|nr:methionyl-tRNA formyltransferase [Clostridia bacterium]